MSFLYPVRLLLSSLRKQNPEGASEKTEETKHDQGTEKAAKEDASSPGALDPVQSGLGICASGQETQDGKVRSLADAPEVKSRHSMDDLPVVSSTQSPEPFDAAPGDGLLPLVATVGRHEKMNQARMNVPKPPNRGQQPQLRVLIIENNDIDRTILARRLRLEGHIVVSTTNGEEGVDAVRSDRDFDCVFMGIELPLPNGYKAIEQIRALEQDMEDTHTRQSIRLNGHIPIFAVSASLSEAPQPDTMCDLGVDGWIVKPTNYKRVLAILRALVDMSQRERDVYTPGRRWELGDWLSSASKPFPHETTPA